MNLGGALAERQLIMVTGKGGVGKTTLAGLIGRYLADRGLRVLLLETDPRESLHQLLGTPPSAGEVLEVGPRLWLQNLHPRAVVEALVREKVPIPLVAKRVIASPVFQHFADGAPGLKEMATLGYARRLVRGDFRRKVDVVVLDAPATGHGASMLTAPLLLERVLGEGQLGEMAADLGRFIGDREKCGVVVGALAEEMPVQEAIELNQVLEERAGRQPDLMIVNALYPSCPRTPPRGVPPSLTSLWRHRHRVNRQEVARLRRAWDGPVLELPLVPVSRGPALLDALLAALEDGLAGEAA